MVHMGLSGMLGAARALPYGARLRAAGWLTSRIGARLAGYDARIRANLAHVLPDLPEAEIRRLCRAVPDNYGRLMIELYSGHEFLDRVAGLDIAGPGLAHLERARAEGRGVLLASGHLGNYDAVRAVLIARGFSVGGLYRPLANRRFNRVYLQKLREIAEPLFPRDRRGLAEMLRFLRAGGMVGVLHDQRMDHGVPLPFMGKPALTALSLAEMALRHDLLLVPAYGIRRPDGQSFDVTIEAPVPHSTAEEMTRALNHSLEARVRDHMDQWLWMHRRWKGADRPARNAAAQRRRSAARIAP
ncbi:lauroyl acyltransferase [Rhodobacteraceae bacterium WD3A24]|nr:lauroyl acyltransferase [Rhodobacteraceae bacterium WD3A24]